MIAWRTSRFLIFFLLIMGGVVAISAAVKFAGPDFADRWRDLVVARLASQPTSSSVPSSTSRPSPIPAALSGGGQPAELSYFPPVHINLPAQSPFDPAGGSAVYCDNYYAGF